MVLTEVVSGAGAVFPVATLAVLVPTGAALPAGGVVSISKDIGDQPGLVMLSMGLGVGAGSGKCIAVALPRAHSKLFGCPSAGTALVRMTEAGGT